MARVSRTESVPSDAKDMGACEVPSDGGAQRRAPRKAR